MAINADLKKALNGTGVPGLFGPKSSEWALGDVIDTMHTELGGSGVFTSVTATTVTGTSVVVADTSGNLTVGGLLANAVTASTAVTGATETITNFSTGTVTIPANSLAVGDRLRIRAMGIHTATTGAETLVLTVRAGSTSLGASGSIDPVANDTFMLDYELFVRSIGASGTVLGIGTITSGTPGGTTAVRHHVSTGSGGTTTVTVDTTAAIVLAFAITHQAAATDANSSRLDFFSVEKF